MYVCGLEAQVELSKQQMLVVFTCNANNETQLLDTAILITGNGHFNSFVAGLEGRHCAHFSVTSSESTAVC